jgi:peptide/nickel transport system substrate-binding protein
MPSTIRSRAARWMLGLIAPAMYLSICAAAAAQDLRIGFKSEVSSADPHVLNGQNRNVWLHVYESLVGQDESLRPVPQLATAWRSVDPLGWEFTLRPQVRFHDGSPLTADDVKFSIDRARGLGGPRTFRTYLKDVDSVQVAGPLTVIVRTRQPSPTLPDNLGLIGIVSRGVGAAGEEDFASGKAAIGTGPYRFVEWKHGQGIQLQRHDGYWGTREPWSKVWFEFLPKEPARASALLSRSVDVIDVAPASVADAFRLSDGQFEVASMTSYMLNYIQLDRFRDNSPYVRSLDDRPLPRNPFNDPRVRQAVTLAIDRHLIVKHVMKGDAQATAQIVPEGFFGHDPTLKPEAGNPARARALLAEAGYPSGFRLTLHCTNDRYLNDSKVCEAVGQMLTKVGIRTAVQTLPGAVFFTRATSGGPNGEPEFSAFMLGVGAVTGEALAPLLAVAHTHDPKSGAGANNRGRYSNKELDALITTAVRTLDSVARDQALREAARLNAADIGIVPLHHLKASWAYRKGLSLRTRSDGFTLAMNIRESRAP